ncbi:MAG: recN [Acidimicrobiales bacterium]|jgi:DNA repair protein RecN (Recombination protein N)|nr:recN [Acidimicrobiales bacterium]
MLTELAVRDLGVIAELSLVLGPGMTALTGETGAGKTLVVEAIELLMGGRADPVLVRPGADEAVVEGRFDIDGTEVVVRRVVSATGRSRAYLDGRLATAAEVASLGARLVDLHGQHAHQALLSARAQRAALDAFGSVDGAPLADARGILAAVDEALAALGGDERARAREIDLLRFQVAELDAAALAGADEDRALEAEQDRLADAVAHRDSGAAAHQLLIDDEGATDAIGAALSAIAGRGPFAELEARLRDVAAEVADVGAELRAVSEGIADDPERLDAVRARRQLLHELRRKYGATLADVLAFATDARTRLAELEQHDRRGAELDGERTVASAAVAKAERAVLAARRAAAPRLAGAVTAHLTALAMARGRLEVAVGDEPPGDDVTFLLTANAGEPALPLTKVASGGELARTMLALRLAVPRLVGSAGTLVFDEVDAGVGGEAALAVGRALSALAGSSGHQVLVVTHLPQVAAFADEQVAVTKDERGGRTVAEARRLAGDERVVELSRMLSGQPESATARDHAEELLAVAQGERSR